MSESHHIRQMRTMPPGGSAPANSITSTPTVAPRAVPTPAQMISVSTSRTRSPGSRAPKRTSRLAATSEAIVVPSTCPTTTLNGVA